MDEERWVPALETLIEFTGSQAATFWVLSPQPKPELTTLRFLNFDPAGMKYYLDCTAALDPTPQYLVSHPDAPIVHDGLVISEREKDRHVYYDWHCGFSDTRYRMVGQARPAPGTQAGVAVHRTGEVGRFESDDIERFAFVHRHMSQALALGSRLGTLGTNRGAQALADGVRISADGVTLAYRRDNDRLQGLVGQAFTAEPAGHSMRALRPSGKRPYAILVGPVSQKYSGLSTVRLAVCIVITDPERATPFLKVRLQAVYGLTEAEAGLAALLVDGEKLPAAAIKLDPQSG